MKLAFMGTPAFAVPALHALIEAGHEIAAVYTQPPRAANRGRVTPSPVQVAAQALGVPVRSPLNFRGEADRAAWAALGLEAAVVAAYGLILPGAILDAPAHGCFNIHASLLPRWRGAAPIQRAVLAGDEHTGVTIMAMERGLDTGPMLLAEATPVAHQTAGALTDELAAMGARLMVEALGRLDTLPRVPQPKDGVTYAAKIDKAEARLDWTQPAAALERAVRAFHPAPGAFFEANGERIRVLAADVLSDGPAYDRVDFPSTPGLVGDQLAIGCGSGALRPRIVQRAGGKPMEIWDFLRGFAIPPGTRL